MPADYLSNSNICKTSPKTRFLDWTATASLDASWNIVVSFSIIDQSVIYPTAIVSIVPAVISQRWTITSTIAFASLVVVDSSKIATTGVVAANYSGQTAEVTIFNNNDIL